LVFLTYTKITSTDILKRRKPTLVYKFHFNLSSYKPLLIQSWS